VDETASQSNVNIKEDKQNQKDKELKQHRNRLGSPVKNFFVCSLKKHMVTSPIFGTHPYLSRLERATIAGSTFMLMITSSSLI